MSSRGIEGAERRATTSKLSMIESGAHTRAVEAGRRGVAATVRGIEALKRGETKEAAEAHAEAKDRLVEAKAEAAYAQTMADRQAEYGPKMTNWHSTI